MKNCPFLIEDKNWCKLCNLACRDYPTCSEAQEAYKTGYNEGLKKANQQISWERDLAISQLADHHIPFGCVQKPLTLEEAIDRTRNVGFVYGEIKEEDCGYFVCALGESPKKKNEIVVLLMGTEEEFHNDESVYGKLFRCWAVPPTDEDILKNEWAEEEAK